MTLTDYRSPTYIRGHYRRNVKHAKPPPPHSSGPVGSVSTISCILTHTTAAAGTPPTEYHSHRHTSPCLYEHSHSQSSIQPPLLHSRAEKKITRFIDLFLPIEIELFDRLHGYSWIKLTSTNERVSRTK